MWYFGQWTNKFVYIYILATDKSHIVIGRVTTNNQPNRKHFSWDSFTNIGNVIVLRIFWKECFLLEISEIYFLHVGHRWSLIKLVNSVWLIQTKLLFVLYILRIIYKVTFFVILSLDVLASLTYVFATSPLVVQRR